MWTRKCSQCIALLRWDCKRGENGSKCQRNNSKNKAFSLQTNVKSSMKKSKDCGGGKNKKHKRNFCFSAAHDDLKTKSFCWMGYLLWARRRVELGVSEETRTWFSKWKENDIPKGGKTPTEAENTHSVAVIPRLYYLSALTSLSEMASCFIQGILE